MQRSIVRFLDEQGTVLFERPAVRIEEGAAKAGSGHLAILSATVADFTVQLAQADQGVARQVRQITKVQLDRRDPVRLAHVFAFIASRDGRVRAALLNRLLRTLHGAPRP